MPERQSPIHVMLVDDRAIIRSGLIAMLSPYPDICVLQEATDGDEAIQLCTEYHPDVILTEITLPHTDGIVATRIIHTRFPATHVVIFTDTVDDALVREAFAAGAIGYLLKNASADEIHNAIRIANQGRLYLDHQVTQCLIHLSTSHHPSLGDNLTNREREVLNLIVAGMTNSTIAETLTVSQSTVKFHVSNILSKLHIRARTEAIGVAMRYHLVN